MKLNFVKLGEGSPLIILHGVFGALDNLMSVAKELAEHHTVYLVDQRNHGKSPHSDEFNYEVMAEDLKEFINDNDIERPAILGHSMGGKTAMKFAITHTNMWDKLIVVDISPKAYPVHHQTILKGLKSIDMDKLGSRSDADKKLAQYVDDLGTRQFLLKNLSRSKDGYSWKLNLKAIDENIEAIGEGLEERLATEKEVLFIRGEKSDYIRNEDYILINQIFPNARIETVEGAGHWVHAEKPKELIELVLSFLK